jgi:thiamine biosynthesis protein ThiS
MAKLPQSLFSEAKPEFNLNSKAYPWRSGLTVNQLLIQIDAQGPGVAVECNGVVIRRAEHQTKLIQEGDQVEIVRLVGGG